MKMRMGVPNAKLAREKDEGSGQMTTDCLSGTPEYHAASRRRMRKFSSGRELGEDGGTGVMPTLAETAKRRNYVSANRVATKGEWCFHCGVEVIAERIQSWIKGAENESRECRMMNESRWTSVLITSNTAQDCQSPS